MAERDTVRMVTAAIQATNHSDAACDCAMCRAAWILIKKINRLIDAGAAVDGAQARFLKAREKHNAKQSINPPTAATMRDINAIGEIDQDLHWCSNDPLPG